MIVPMWKCLFLQSDSLFSLQVPNDFLDLQVPIWVTDLGFLPSQGAQARVAVGTGYHQVRLYDTKAQRRPVLSFDFGESPVSALAVTDNEK